MGNTTPVGADDFSALIKPVVGLTVTRLWRGYGSATFLELGPLRRVPRVGRRPGHYLKGAATLMIEFSWRIESTTTIEAGSFSTDDEMNQAIRSLRGTLVRAVMLFGSIPEIAVELDDGRTVRSFMTADGDPAWTLFLPDRSWLCVRYGKVVREREVPPSA